MQAVALEAAVARRRIVPGDQRTSPAQLELCLAVPAGTRSLTLSIDFQKAFLTVFEHPPDASRWAGCSPGPDAVVLHPCQQGC